MKLKALLLTLCLFVSTSAYAGNIETNGATSETPIVADSAAVLDLVQFILSLN